jgi:Arc/MetJ-type ribon-helix-helix transcriptional regulator
MPRRTIRLSAEADERLQSAVKVRGYANPSAFLRAAMDHELKGREETMLGAEERLATSIDHITREISRLGRAQQALFALVDSLAKILLTCIPEPDGEAMEAAVTRAKGRHVRLLKSAGQAIAAQGRVLRLSRDFIREGIRHITEDLCTRQLGYRTEFDAADAQRREVHQHRYTSLDPIIQRDAERVENADSPFFTASKDPSRAGLSPSTFLIERRTAERLMVLESIGLAESAGPKTWRVRRDFANVLRAMQRSADRQKTLAAYGALVSDDRLQMTVQDLRSLTALEGRVLVHGEEEYSGRSYLILEGTDARLHYITYTPEIEVAGACERILSFSFESRLRRAARHLK